MSFQKYLQFRVYSPVLFCAGALIVSQAGYATSGIRDAWRTAYPDSTSDDAGCQLCHDSSTSRLNPYGNDLCLANRNFAAIERDDSDSDPTASDNITEIDANAQPGWTEGDNPVYETNNCGQFAAFVNIPSGVPQPYDPVGGSDPIADAAGPYDTVLGNAITFDGTGSSDDGSITEYFWDFGNGSTATGDIVTYTYAAVGVYDVTLSVTDNDGNTASDTTTATVIEPAALDLDIASFRVSKNVRLGRDVKIVLTISNEGTIDGEATATLLGEQNGSVIVEQTDILVFDSVGNGRTTFDLGPYTPTDTGEILWTVTVDDGDPDTDEATATTNVR
ncbi:MAG: PKD domain-containing protein [Chromatiales bacterium]|jgi:chitodextrinase